MFGIEFPELIVIAVVALIVIGPEHLPKVARTIGHLWGRAQRYVNTVKADISRDMALDELRQMQQKTQQEIGSVQQSVTEAAQEWEQQVKEFESDTKQGGNEIAGQEIPRHEIIEEQAAVIPAVPEQKKTTNT
jgi:sec-independent protein translocase protein TatB